MENNIELREKVAHLEEREKSNTKKSKLAKAWQSW